MNKETLNSGQEELNTPQPNQEVKANTVLETSSYQELEVEEEDHDDDDHEENEKLSLKELVDKLEKLINLENAGEEIQKFNALRKSISEQIDEITENKNRSLKQQIMTLRRFSVTNTLYKQSFLHSSIFLKRRETSLLKSKRKNIKKI